MPGEATSPEGAKRLSAILFADMVGYSSLGQEEAARCKAEMLTLTRERLERHAGRLIKTLGDGFLAEFPAATQAVAFAIELQDAVTARHAQGTAPRRFRLRIGIHAGEVLAREGDVEGTTVNIAARAEPLAAPGGVCLTEEVWQQVREGLPRPADRLGRIRVKGIRRRLVFYHLPRAGAGWLARQQPRLRRWRSWPGQWAAAGLGVAALLALAVWLQPVAPEALDDIFPPSPARRVQRARTRLERYDRPGNIDHAILDLLEAVRFAPKYTEAQELLGVAYWRQYKFLDHIADRFEAWTASSNALACNPESVPGLFVQGMVAKDQGKNSARREEGLRGAADFLRRANDSSAGSDGEVLVELADTYRLLGDAAQAEHFLQAAIEKSKRGKRTWYWFNALAACQTMWATNQASWEMAERSLETAISLASDSPFAWLNLGLVLDSQEGEAKHERALKCFQEARRLWPNANAYYGLGQHYLNEDNWLGAATNFDAAADLNESRYDYFGNAGLALAKLPGRQADAQRRLNQAIEKATSLLTQTSRPLATANLGLYQAALGRAEEACQTFEGVCRDFPKHPQVKASVGEAIPFLEQQGHPAEVSRLRKLLGEAPPAGQTP